MAAILPNLKGLQENTLIDWEGRLATIVFLPGCNFRCPFCHSRHLVLAADVLESIPLEAVDQLIERDRGWLDGVVISGGEPTIEPRLADLIEHFRALRMPVKLNTNGSRPDVLAELMAQGLLEAVAMDVKAPLDERYERCAGVAVDLDAVRQSIELIIAGDIEYEFCTTVCPPLLGEEDVVDTARAVRGARSLVLQRFAPLNCIDPALLDARPYELDLMRTLAARAQKYVQRCTVRGDPAETPRQS